MYMVVFGVLWISVSLGGVLQVCNCMLWLCEPVCCYTISLSLSVCVWLIVSYIFLCLCVHLCVFMCDSMDIYVYIL